MTAATTSSPWRRSRRLLWVLWLTEATGLVPATVYFLCQNEVGRLDVGCQKVNAVGPEGSEE